MSDGKFVWDPAPSPTEWDTLVAASSQGSIFFERLFLDAVGREYATFVVRRGTQCRAGVTVLLSADGQDCELDDFVIHNGVLFAVDETKKPVRRRFEAFELTEFVIARLDERFNHIALALPPGIEDLRPFQWHNYHAESAPRFALDLRYTSYVDTSTLWSADDDEHTDAFRRMDTLRQRHVRDARKAGAVVRPSTAIETFVAYYRDLMQRQGETVSDEALHRLKHLTAQLVAADRATLFEVVNADGTVVYFVLYAWDRHRAYYLFGAGHATVAEAWQGTIAHWGAFRHLASRHGIREVDLEGVNSPRRGWFKLGFGGDLRPYYHVSRGSR